MEFDADGAVHQLRRPANSLPTVEELLGDHASELGHDLIAYRNHVYRACDGIRMLPQERGPLSGENYASL